MMDSKLFQFSQRGKKKAAGWEYTGWEYAVYLSLKKGKGIGFGGLCKTKLIFSTA